MVASSENRNAHHGAPHPKARFLVGNLPELRKDSVHCFLEWSLTYGRVVQFKIGPKVCFLVNDPSHIKHILLDNHKNYYKIFGYKQMFPIFGQGLLTSDGPLWRRQRKLISPIFHKQRLEKFVDIMTACTASVLSRWQAHEASGEPFDMTLEMRDVTMNIVTQSLLGSDVSNRTEEVSEALIVLLSEAYRRLGVHLSNYLPTPRRRYFDRANARFNSTVSEIITKRRHDPRDRGDLLSMLMLARDEETNEQMDDTQLLDEVKTMFLAGHETSANSLSFTWYLLSMHPSVERRLRAEIEDVLGDRPPRLEDLPRLQYTTMVIDESLRLYPTVWNVTRDAIEEDRIGDYTIPAKSVIFISPFVMHHSPAFWENPEGFDPDRFTPENVEQRPYFVYFPFGVGPRICAGNNFAMMEMKIILAMAMQRYRVHLMPGRPMQLEPGLTLRPRDPLMVTVQLCSPARAAYTA